MAIGNFGSLIRFRVSDDKVLTFKNFQKTVKGRWGTLTPVYGKPISYFQGPDLDEASLEIHLDAGLGVRPATMIRRIERAVSTGKTAHLVIGGRRMSQYRMAIEQMSEAYDVVMRDGGIYQATLQLTFREYVY